MKRQVFRVFRILRDPYEFGLQQCKDNGCLHSTRWDKKRLAIRLEPEDIDQLSKLEKSPFPLLLLKVASLSEARLKQPEEKLDRFYTLAVLCFADNDHWPELSWLETASLAEIEAICQTYGFMDIFLMFEQTLSN